VRLIVLEAVRANPKFQDSTAKEIGGEIRDAFKRIHDRVRKQARKGPAPLTSANPHGKED